MYGALAVTAKSPQDYAPIVGETAIGELINLAKPLKGLRVLNLSVTGFGTGVAELLRCSVPLLSGLGLDCQWQVVRSNEEFTQATKSMYRALAGGRVTWTKEMTNAWRQYTIMNAELFTEDFDVVIVHDPQPTAIRSHVESGRRPRSQWILHCHMDLSSAQRDVWHLLRGHIEKYDALIFEDEAFVGESIRSVPLNVIPPAIDPLGPRNMEISGTGVANILKRYGIDVERPLLCQVAPLSESSDALGAIEVYRLALQRVPGLQLAMVATSLPEDPLAYSYFDQVVTEAAEFPDVHILSNLNDVGNVEVNILQRAARTVMQKALQKGFGIWLSDALWKETPVVAAAMGGIPKQVIHGKTGYLASDTKEFADRVVALVEDADLAQELGSAGHQHVVENFLITRYLADYLRLLQGMSSYRF